MQVTHLPNDNSTNPDPTLDADVIIVGGGPAGATVAYYLSLAKRKVLLIEQQKFPREKTCGDFASPGTIRELERIGVAQLPEFTANNVINKSAVYLDGKELVSGSFPALPDLPQYGKVVSRKLLDRLIFEAAQKTGAIIIEGYKVTDFQVQENCVIVTAKKGKEQRQFQSKLLIGADGNNSVVARILRGAPWPEANRAFVARGYFENVTGDPSRGDLYYNSESMPGYSWLFATSKSQANVGVGIVQGSLPSAQNPKDLLLQLISQDAGMRSRLENATLKGEVNTSFLNLYDPQLPIIASRVMLIGEAAGLVNMFNGEGIQFALLSGRWASKTALSCLDKDDFSENALSAYPKQVEDELGYAFKVAGFMIQLLRNRNMNIAWLQALEAIGLRSKSDPEYARLTSGILSGMIIPNQEITAKIVSGAFQEATLTAGLTTLNNALNDPSKLQETALKITQTGFEVAQYAVQDPFSFLKWGMDTAVKMTEIAVAVTKQVAKETQENSTGTA